MVESKGKGNGGGGEDAQVRTSVSIFLSLSFLLSSLSLSLPLSSSLFLPAAAAAAAANGITRIPHFKRRFIHPTSSGRDELTIDRIDTVSAGESHVCARAGNACFARGRRLYLPREIASVPFPRAHHLARPAIAYAVKPFFHYEIVTVGRRGKRVMRRDRQSPCFFYATLKYALSRFMRIP